jgi:hypothetical protein
MHLLYLLIEWLTPILLFFLLVYIDMKKGESVKEYFEKYDHPDLLFLLVIPVVNIAFVFIFVSLVIYNRISNFRK